MAAQFKRAMNADNRLNKLTNENFREDTEFELQKFLDQQKSFRNRSEKSGPELRRSLSLPPPQRKNTVTIYMKTTEELQKVDSKATGSQNIKHVATKRLSPDTIKKFEGKTKEELKESSGKGSITDGKVFEKKEELIMANHSTIGEQNHKLSSHNNQKYTSKKYHVVTVRECANKQHKQLQGPCTSLENNGRYFRKNETKTTVVDGTRLLKTTVVDGKPLLKTTVVDGTSLLKTTVVDGTPLLKTTVVDGKPLLKTTVVDGTPLLKKLRNALVVWNDDEEVLSEKMMQQVDIYVNWINGQLHKRPNSRKVTLLAEDMKDGVAFLQLVEVISQEKQDIIESDSLSLSDMRLNLTNVLHFLSKNNIRVHHILPKEIMEGKLKATMRLVLALAAHFKPESFKNQNRHQTTKEQLTKPSDLHRATSLVSLASNAAASLVEASRNANSSGKLTHYKHRNQTSTPKRPRPVFSATCPGAVPRSGTGKLRLENAEIPDLCNASGGKKSSQARNRPSSSSSSMDSQDNNRHKNFMKNIIEQECDTDEDGPEILRRHDMMLDDVTGAKEVLIQLQELLLNGCTLEEKLGIDSSNDDSFQEQLVMKNIILEQKVQECDDVKSQLNELKEINMSLTGDKRALETRVSQQEQLILSLKSKLLQYEINSKNPNERELEILLHERDKELHMLHEEMGKRDEVIQKQKVEIDTLSNNIVTKKRIEANLYAKIESSESMVSNLRMQVQELTNQLHNASLYEKTNQAGGTNTESLRSRMSEAKFLKEKQKIFREHKNMKVTLNNVKERFRPDDPIQHAFQSMEQSMMSLDDIVSMMENSTHAKESRPTVVPRAHPVNIKSPTSSDSGYDHNGNISLDGGEQIKVVYYLGKSITPVLKMTEIGIGFFTLKDFKQLVKRPGSYRYFFKAVDRDFGFVREELLYDDDIVPGHENKVVAWMEKRIGEEV